MISFLFVSLAIRSAILVSSTKREKRADDALQRSCMGFVFQVQKPCFPCWFAIKTCYRQHRHFLISMLQKRYFLGFEMLQKRNLLSKKEAKKLGFPRASAEERVFAFPKLLLEPSQRTEKSQLAVFSDLSRSYFKYLAVIWLLSRSFCFQLAVF